MPEPSVNDILSGAHMDAPIGREDIEPGSLDARLAGYGTAGYSRPEWTDPNIPIGRRVQDFMETQARARTPRDQTFESFERHFPGVDPQHVAGLYGTQTRLEEERGALRGQGEHPLAFLARRSLPVISAVANFLRTNSYNNAQHRIAEGNPEPDDYAKVAHYEWMQGLEKERGFGARLLGTAAHVPAWVGEFAIPGAIGARGFGLAARAAAPAAGTAAPSLAARGAGLLGPALSRTAAAPSMYLPGWAERNLEAGLPAPSPGMPTGASAANLGRAYAFGAIQTALLGTLGKAAELIPGRGLGPVVARIGASGALGAVEMRGLEAIAGATGLQTGYGTIDDFAHGREGEAWQHVAIDALTFAAFSAMHGRTYTGPPLEPFAHAVRGLRDRGFREDKARELIQHTHDMFAAAVAEPGAHSRETLERLAGNLPMGPTRDYGLHLAHTLRLEPFQQTAQGPSPGLEPLPPGFRTPEQQAAQGPAPGIDAPLPERPSPPSPPGAPPPPPPEPPVPPRPPAQPPAQEVGPTPTAAPASAEPAAQPAPAPAAPAPPAPAPELTRAEADVARRKAEGRGRFANREESYGHAIANKLLTDQELFLVQAAMNGEGGAQARLARMRGISQTAAGKIDRAALSKMVALDPENWGQHRSLAQIARLRSPPEGAEGLIQEGLQEAVDTRSLETGGAPTSRVVPETPDVGPAIEPPPQELFGLIKKKVQEAGPPPVAEAGTAAPSKNILEWRRQHQREINETAAEVRQAGRPPLSHEQIEAAGAEHGQQVAEAERAQAAEAAGAAAQPRTGGPGEPATPGAVAEPGGAPGLGGRESGSPPERPGFGEPLTEAERAAIPKIFTSESDMPSAARRTEGWQTALAEEYTDRNRQKLGLPPIEKPIREKNPEAWARVKVKLRGDPEAAAKLVDELHRTGRPMSPEDAPFLLQRRVTLRNEVDRLHADTPTAYMTGDAITIQGLEARAEHLTSEINKLDAVVKRVGGDAGWTLQFFRQLASDEFSLGPMMRRAEAARVQKLGRELTPEERAVLLEDVTKQAGEIKAAQDRAEAAQEAVRGVGGEKAPGAAELVASKEYLESGEAGAVVAKLKDRFRSGVEADKEAGGSLYDKIERLLVKTRVAFVISGVKTLAKIAASGLAQTVVHPAYGAAAALWRMMPGFDKIAAKSARWGRGPSAEVEAKSAMSGWTEGLKDAWEVFRTGKSELERAHGGAVASEAEGRGNAPVGWLDLPGVTHGALKAPAVRVEYTRSLLQRLDGAAEKGLDIRDPSVLLPIQALAFKDAVRVRFGEENAAVSLYRNAITRLRQAGGIPRAFGIGLQLALPVVRIPTNLVAQTFELMFGTVLGSVRAARGLRDGVEKMPQEQADLIMRNMAKGSVGLVLLGIGLMNPEVIGGYYSGKRREDELPVGAIGTAESNVPTWLLHNPALEVLQVGATIRRALDSTRKDPRTGLREHPDHVTAFYRGLSGLVQEIPFVQETLQTGRAFEERSQGRMFGELAKSLVVPQLFQWIAGAADTDEQGNPIRRRPQGLLEHIETGIPGVRQQVPAQPVRGIGSRRRAFR